MYLSCVNGWFRGASIVSASNFHISKKILLNFFIILIADSLFLVRFSFVALSAYDNGGTKSISEFRETIYVKTPEYHW